MKRKGMERIIIEKGGIGRTVVRLIKEKESNIRKREEGKGGDWKGI